MRRGRMPFAFMRRCAAAGALLFPLLAALHLAGDDAHLASGHLRSLGDPTPAAVHAHVHGSGHGHDQSDRGNLEFCDFCVLAGASLLATAEHVSHGQRNHAAAVRPSGAQWDGYSARLRRGNPVRAPPP